MQWRNGTNHWGMISVALHWVTALAVFGLFGLGLWMITLGYYDAWYQKGPDLHRSIGVLLFILTALRLLWRLIAGHPQALPQHRQWEQMAAKIAHLLLYLLLFAVMISGYLITTADGRSISVFGWFQLPATLYGLKGQEDIAGEVHLALAWTLIGLALLHAVAALKHHFFNRDSTLSRMLGLSPANHGE